MVNRPDQNSNVFERRRVIGLLPQVYRNSTLQKFLASTADNLFQPEAVETINAYIGRIPSYYDPTQDFYKSEPSLSRQAYQLEPTMVSISESTGTTSEALFYPDLINQLRFQGALIDNEDRLFESTYYSWCPPIDIDKLLNYRLYYWVRTPEPIVIIGPYTTYTGTGLSSYSNIPAYSDISLIRMKVNGIDKTYGVNYTIIGQTLVFLIDYPILGDVIEVWTHTNISNIIGSTTYEINGITFSSGQRVVFLNDINTSNNGVPFIVENVGVSILLVDDRVGTDTLWDREEIVISNPSISYTVDITDTITFTGIPNYSNPQNLYVEVNEIGKVYGIDYIITGQTITFATPLNVGDLVQIFSRTDVATEIAGKTNYVAPDGTVLADGSFIYVGDDINPMYTGNSYIIKIIDGVLTLYQTYSPYGHWDDIRYPWSRTLDDSTPDYITISRGGLDQNSWAQTNRWFHQDVLTPDTLAANINNYAVRPIVEFERNIELYNYGSFARTPVNLFDNTLTDVFGTFFTAVPGQFEIDGVVVEAGMRILFTADNNPLVNNRIYTVSVIQTSSTVQNFVLILATDGTDITGAPSYGENVSVLQGVKNTETQYWFNSTSWTLSQVKSSVNQPPLFQLYDDNEVQLQNSSTYPGSNFVGNKIFGYKIDETGDGANPDTVLGFIPTYNSYGNFVFQNYIVSPFDNAEELADTIYSYNNGNITGYYFWHQVPTNYSSEYYGNNWYQSIAPSRQLYVDNYISLNGQNTFVLSQAPDLPLNGIIPYVEPTVYASLNNVELTLDVDYSINGREITINNISNGDTLEVRTYSAAGPSWNGGYFEIPKNLEANPNNLDVTEISINQYFDQFNNLLISQAGFVGLGYNVNNSRDIPIDRSLGKIIIQNTAPLLKTMLLSSNKNLDFMLSIRYVEREYVRFKNKYIQTMETLLRQGALSSQNTPAQWYAAIMKSINVAKTINFPFAYSGVAGQYSYIPGTPAYLGVLPCWVPRIFTDTSYQYARTVILGHDGSIYVAFDDFRDNVILYLETQIYNSIQSQYQGVRPKFDYTEYVENKWKKTSSNFDTYWNTSSAIQWTTNTSYSIGQLIEYQANYYICANANISTSFSKDLASNYWILLKKAEYSINDFNTLLKPSFDRWATAISADYMKNNSWSQDDPFTWNYSQTLDRDGESLPGYWRQIYRYYYDTDRPHSNPWEMLGFTEKPSYWDQRYGAAPYTRGNVLLWTDLKNGYIASGSRQGIDPNFSRPGLLEYIPVDDWGNLLNPIQAGIVVNPPSYQFASANWEFGDGGPVENAWIKSEYYGYDVVAASYLMKPAAQIEFGWDPLDVGTLSNGQIYSILLGNRGGNSQLYVHGEKLNGSIIIRYGLQQWITDYLVSTGQDPTVQFGPLVRGLNVQLGHKLAGFINTDDISYTADNFGLIPQEDVTTALYKSPSIREEFYGGVIVEYTGSSYRIFGYDVLSLSFSTIASDKNGPSIKVNIGSGPAVNIPTWTADTYYPIGFDVIYEGNYFTSNINQISGTDFIPANWTGINKPPNPPLISVIEYQQGVSNNAATQVQYGTEFGNVQAVYDFLMSYQRYLVSRGWIFETVDPVTGEIRNWQYSGKEFLVWSTQNWDPGTFISLSPAAENVVFRTAQGMVESVEQLINGTYSALDKAGVPINLNDISVTRFDYELSVTTRQTATQYIYGLRLYITEMENVILFNNITRFNDLIYDPLLDLRQERIKINVIRTLGWNGRPFTPGYFLTNNNLALNENQTILSIGSGITTNFEKTVTDFRHYFDVLKPVEDSVLRNHARHTIGYQERDYLDNLLITDNTSQFQFYQGMIQKKGTADSFTKLLRSQLVMDNADLTFFEEWAFRVGIYGANDLKKTLEVLFQQTQIKADPQLIEFKYIVDPYPEDFGLTTHWDRQSWDNPKYPWSAYSTSKNNLGLDGGFPDNLYDDVIQIFDWFDDNGKLILKDSRWERRPVEKNTVNGIIGNTYYEHIFPLRSEGNQIKGDIQSAGYVKLTEILYTAFDYDALSTLYTNLTLAGTSIKIGDTFWIYNIPKTTWSNYELTWTVLRASNPVASGVVITQVSTGSLNGDPCIVTTNVPHGLKTGDWIIINGTAGVSPEIAGLQVVLLANDPSLTTSQFTIDVSILSTQNYNNGTTTGPSILLLDEVRFPTTTIRNNNTPAGGWLAGDYVWVDNDPTYWSTYQYENNSFTLIRSENAKVDSKSIVNGLVYNKVTNRITTQIQIFDPYKGIIPGVADKEITYKIEYDPAVYNQGDSTVYQIDPNQAWGLPQVGQVWWDLSQTRYLDYEIGQENEVDYHRYRWNNWGALAPGTSIVLYEWVRSTVPPSSWATYVQNFQQGQSSGSGNTPTGTVKNVDNPAWVQTTEYDPTSDSLITYYYFWVTGATTIPSVPFRNLDITSVAGIITDPTAYDIPWFAAISPSGVIVSGVSQFLDNTDTVLQINWRDGDLDINEHYQWVLAREGDPLDVIEDVLWNKMRDSLLGFDALGNVLPDPMLTDVEAYGSFIRPRQTWFQNVIKARHNFVENINILFSQTTVIDDRLGWQDVFLAIQPLPVSGDKVVFNSTDSMPYVLPFGYDTSEITVYLYAQNSLTLFTDYTLTLNSSEQYEIVTSFVLSPNDQLIVNSSNFYQYQINSRSLINTISPAIGDQLLITYDGEADNFWTLSQWNGTSYTLLKTQLWRLTDFWSYADWYATGYSSANIPVLIYPTYAALFADRVNINNGILVQYTDADGLWNLMVYDKTNDTFTLVGKQNSTIQLSSNFYNPDLSIYGFNGQYELNSTAIENRDGTYELQQFLSSFRNGFLTDLEQNLQFFNLVNYVHTEQSMIDWVFKTSYIYLGGYNQILGQPAIQPENVTENVFDYINEIKPYHVKIRDYVQQLTYLDTGNFRVTDFDNPVYLDNNAIVPTYRNLDPNNVSDQSILSTQLPWSEWYNNYLTNPNLIRSFQITLVYDRVTCDAGTGWSNFAFNDEAWGLREATGAAGRIAQYYQPLGENPEKTMKTLISGCDCDINIVEGGKLQDERWATHEYDNLEDAIDPNNILGWASEDEFDVDLYLNSESLNVASYRVYSFDLYEYDQGVLGYGSLGIPQITYSIPGGTPQDLTQIRVFLNNTLLATSQYSVDVTPANTLSIPLLIDISFTEPSDPYVLMPQNVAFSSQDLAEMVVLIEVGTGFAPLPQNPWDIVIEGGPLYNPVHRGCHPEELIPLKIKENLLIDVYTERSSGSPVMLSNRFLGDAGTVYPIGQRPQNIEAVVVYHNGSAMRQKLDPTQPYDFTIDWINCTVNFVQPTTYNDFYVITSFGLGGVFDNWPGNSVDYPNYVDSITGLPADPVTDPNAIPVSPKDRAFETLHVVFDGITTSFTFNNFGEIGSTQVIILYNGEPTTVNSNQIVGNTVNLATPLPSVGTNIDIYIISKKTSDDGFASVRKDIFPYNGPYPATFTLKQAPLSTLPQKSTVMVSAINLVESDTVEFQQGDLEMTWEVVFGQPINEADLRFSGVNGGFQFALNKNIVIQMELSGDDWDVQGDQLIIYNAPPGTIAIQAITIQENREMKIVTLEVNGNSNGLYPLTQCPLNENHLWINLNGKRQFFGRDFTLVEVQGGWATTPWSGSWSNEPKQCAIQFSNGQQPEDNLWITTLAGQTSQPPVAFRLINDARNNISSIRISDAHKTFLKNDLLWTDSTIQLYVNQGVYSSNMPDNILTIPDIENNIPGVIWIENERIEYWTLSGTGNLNDPILTDSSGHRYFEIGSLKRGTRSTAFAPKLKSSVQFITSTGNTTQYTFSTTGLAVYVYINEVLQNINIDYSISANTIYFTKIPPKQAEIKVLTILSDWNTSQISYPKGTTVIDGSNVQLIPGGIIPEGAGNWDNGNWDSGTWSGTDLSLDYQGMQYANTPQSKFLKQYPGTPDKY